MSVPLLRNATPVLLFPLALSLCLAPTHTPAIKIASLFNSREPRSPQEKTEDPLAGLAAGISRDDFLANSSSSSTSSFAESVERGLTPKNGVTHADFREARGSDERFPLRGPSTGGSLNAPSSPGDASYGTLDLHPGAQSPPFRKRTFWARWCPCLPVVVGMYVWAASWSKIGVRLCGLASVW